MRVFNIPTFVALSAVFILTSCSSAQKRAGEMMEKGDYEAAAATYESVVARDPENAEAQAGLKAARSKVLDQRLINVRKAREGGSGLDAANLLLGVLALEKRWNMQPPGAAVFTQQEEAGFATGAVLGYFRQTPQSAFPLRQELDLRKYEPLFQQSRAGEFASVRAANQKEGRAQCRRYARQVRADTPYTADFVARFCGFFGEDDVVEVDEKTIHKTLFREVKVSPNLQGFPQETPRELAVRLNDALHGTPWFSADGSATQEVKLDGVWNQTVQRNTTQLVYQYKEREKYVDYVDVAKTRQVPYELTEYVLNPVTGKSDPVTRVAYRNETYTEREPRELFREVQKSYPYGGWNVVQDLKLALEGSTLVSGRTITLAVHDESHAQDTASDVANPSIGLQPKQPTALPDQMQWLRAHEDALSQQLRAALMTAWNDLYCSDAPLDNFALAGNRARQCLRLQSAAAQPPKFVEDWHQRYFGLGQKQVEELLRTAEK